MLPMSRSVALVLLATASSSLLTIPAVHAADSLVDALQDGKASFLARARYESVQQKNALKDADAFTLRSVLGYETGVFHGFHGMIEIEDVTHLGGDNFNSTTNGETDYSVIADPDGTEVNQAYLSYSAFDTTARFGRQIITYRDAPFHRFIGTVGWRQNWQTFDAFSLQNTSLPDTRLSYAYINKVNTIFADRDAPAAGISNGNIDLDAHLVNVVYDGFDIGDIEAYGYFFDYQDAAIAANSSQTLGLRFSGNQPVSDDWSVLYAAEFAQQDDYQDGLMDKQDYYLAEVGAKYNGWMVKLAHEVQEGDGTSSFKTPLGTNHAFQGWADQFLATPPQGLQDTSLTVSGSLLGGKLIMAYHDYQTDQNSLDAGDEINVLLQKTFHQHYTLGVKYADYNADDDFTANVDTEKFWLFGQVKF
jgi:hypothetical protein